MKQILESRLSIPLHITQWGVDLNPSRLWLLLQDILGLHNFNHIINITTPSNIGVMIIIQVLQEDERDWTKWKKRDFVREKESMSSS